MDDHLGQELTDQLSELGHAQVSGVSPLRRRMHPRAEFGATINKIICLPALGSDLAGLDIGLRGVGHDLDHMDQLIGRPVEDCHICA